MLSTDQELMEEHRKKLAAMQRAIPITRMVDYGVPAADAQKVHLLTSSEDSPDWDEACEALAKQHLSEAAAREGDEDIATAGQSLLAAVALLQCAQLAFNSDSPRKRALYEAAHAAAVRHGQIAGDLEDLVLTTSQGTLYGWIVRPSVMPTGAAVLVVGGLSGWGSAYLAMARSLAARGILAILAEGPGQGLTRMRSGLHMNTATFPLFSTFLDHAQLMGATRLGVCGNSFGGLFAANIAALDRRVQAVCINGAPMAPQVPSFRTAREQMNAVFDVTADEDLARQLQSITLSPERHRINGTMLILEGGRDPLVPLGEQASFLELVGKGMGRLRTWEDGEHTLYNHAVERNAVVAKWFAENLMARAEQ